VIEVVRPGPGSAEGSDFAARDLVDGGDTWIRALIPSLISLLETQAAGGLSSIISRARSTTPELPGPGFLVEIDAIAVA
jgi:hypothetical protein